MIWTRGARLSAGTILAFLILATISLIWLAAIQSDMQAEMAESNLWAAAQSERESLRYRLALQGEDAEATALQFEILYSRIALLASNPQRAFFASLGQAEAVDEAMAVVRAIEGLRPEARDRAAPDATDAILPQVERLTELTQGIALATYLGERRNQIALRTRERHVTNLLTASVLGGFAAGLVMASLLIRRTRGLLRMGAELEEHQRSLERTIAERTDKLRDALGAERRAKEVYRSFVVTVSHQFRTSLSIIHLTAQRQLRRPAAQLDPGLRGKFSRIVDAADRLERLIDGFLEAAAFERRALDGGRSLIDVNAVVAVAVAQTRATHPDRQLICAPAPGALPLEGDAVLLEQVVLIILSNALKYSAAPDPVQIATSLREGVIRCTIDDRGCGIPEESLDAIFEPYFRASNAHRFPGVGVGLSLAAKFVDLHGGRIDVTSTLGEGTRFTICLPAAEGEAS